MKAFMHSKFTKFFLMFVIYSVIFYALSRLISDIKLEFYNNIKNQTKLYDLITNLDKQMYITFLLGGLLAALTPFFFKTSPKEKKEK